MGYLVDSKWENGRGLEDLVTWGIMPMFHFINLFDEYTQDGPGPEDDYACFLYYEMKNKLLDMEKVIYKFRDEIDKKPSTRRRRLAAMKNFSEQNNLYDEFTVKINNLIRKDPDKAKELLKTL